MTVLQDFAYRFMQLVMQEWRFKITEKGKVLGIGKTVILRTETYMLNSIIDSVISFTEEPRSICFLSFSFQNVSNSGALKSILLIIHLVRLIRFPSPLFANPDWRGRRRKKNAMDCGGSRDGVRFHSQRSHKPKHLHLYLPCWIYPPANQQSHEKGRSWIRKYSDSK